jgi:hypothetical protein
MEERGMDQPALNYRLDRDGICGELFSTAQRELASLFKAVTELFGQEQAELSAGDWLREVESARSLPASAREWRQITVRVIATVAGRSGQTIAVPASAQLQPVG